MFKLKNTELERIHKILKKAFDKESGKLTDQDLKPDEDSPEGCKLILNNIDYNSFTGKVFLRKTIMV